MRAVVRFLLVAMIVVVVGVWFLIFRYSGDLPDVGSLVQFAPANVTRANDPCLPAAAIAVPYDSIGNNLREALSAAGVSESGPGVVSELYGEFTYQATPRRPALSVLISRSMFCTPSKALVRHFEEFRVAAQLERRYSRRELFTIFANRAWFGDDLVGVQAASQGYLHKDANQLGIGDAALLAGLIRAPAILSPINHPDRALKRRNEVIDAMIQTHAITAQEGEIAKASVLLSN